MGVDIQGARQIRRTGLPVTTIFILPPSFKALGERLHRRGTETLAQIRARLQLAKHELTQMKQYDYVVVNDRLVEAIDCVRAILRAEQCRVTVTRGGYFLKTVLMSKGKDKKDVRTA